MQTPTGIPAGTTTATATATTTATPTATPTQTDTFTPGFTIDQGDCSIAPVESSVSAWWLPLVPLAIAWRRRWTSSRRAIERRIE